VEDFPEYRFVASVAWPVPIAALQWGEVGMPVSVAEVAVALLFAARPVPIAAVQSSAAASAYADEADSKAAMKVTRSVFMVDRSCGGDLVLLQS
jgi:hypothetical protein